MNEAEKQKELEKVSLKNKTKIHEGSIITLSSETFHYNGIDHSFDIVEHPGAASIVAVDDSGKIALVRQYRRAAHDILLEIPAGLLEKNETPLDCATRELQEEIGMKPLDLKLLTTILPNPGFCSEQVHIFLATKLTPSVLESDEGEFIDVLYFSLDECINLINSRKIIDAKTICGLYQYKEVLEKKIHSPG